MERASDWDHAGRLEASLSALDARDPRYATEAVERLLRAARAAGASDLHLTPAEEGLKVDWRRDGVLQRAALLPLEIAPNVVARMKVLAGLLTYQTDLPQEGRMRFDDGVSEMRLSTFPTLRGEKAVVRLFAATGRFERLDELGLPEEILEALTRRLGETTGAIVVSGPAGSGKTTTIYACLRALVESAGGRRSIATLEDPVEVEVAGVTQSQVNPRVGLTLEAGLRWLLRQDPEVIVVGEIRDKATAETAFQASLTGHLVLTSFHAGSAAGAVSRLADMGVEPFMLRGGVLGILSQRLARRLCDCAVVAEDPARRLGLRVGQVRVPVGCEQCGGTGYRGRIVLAEWLEPAPGAVGRAVLDRADAPTLERLAVEAGMVTRWDRARAAAEAGTTSPDEIRRVLGWGGDDAS